MSSQPLAAVPWPVATLSVAIVASVPPTDFSRLDREMASLQQAGDDRVQWDVMNGQFVPNLTFGPEVMVLSHPTADFHSRLI